MRQSSVCQLRVCLVSVIKWNGTGRFHSQSPFSCLDRRRNGNPPIPGNGIFHDYAKPGRSSKSAGSRETPRSLPFLHDSPTPRPSHPRLLLPSLPRWANRRPAAVAPSPPAGHHLLPLVGTAASPASPAPCLSSSNPKDLVEGGMRPGATGRPAELSTMATELKWLDGLGAEK